MILLIDPKDMIAHLWPYINVSSAKLVKEVVEPLFEDLLPGPLKSTKFLKIDLGKNPIVLDRADVHTRSKDSIKLEIDVSWDGLSDIQLQSPMIGKYGVRRIGLTGRLSVIMQPLMPVMPVVGALQVSFLNPPTVSMDFTGIADIADVALLKRRIRKIINQVIANMFVMPNRLLVPISPAFDFFASVIPPLGVVRIKVESGNGFKSTGTIIKDVPDMYAKLTVGGEKEVQTKTINNKNDPVWNASFDFLYCDPQQLIHLHAWEDDVTGDDNAGGAIFPVAHVLDAPDNRRKIGMLLDGKPTGSSITISADIHELSNLKTNFDIPSPPPGPHTMAGLLTIIVAGAHGIPDSPDLATFCKINIGAAVELRTATVTKMPLIDPRTPSYNFVHRMPLTHKTMAEAPSVKFELMDGTNSLGSAVVEFNDILESHEMKMRKDLEMGHGAQLKVCVVLNSLSS